jgi:hypothetical protein
MRHGMKALVLIGLLGSLAGCVLFNPPPAVQPQLLYSENFSSSTAKGWWQGIDPPGEWIITGGRYYGTVLDEDSYYYVYTTAAPNLTDFSARVTTGQQGTATDHSWGIIFRAGDERFYAFEISADGYVLVSVYTPADWSDLYGWALCSAIRPAGQTNELRVDAQGTTFSFYVNGTYVTQVTDATLASGSIGFIVETWDDPNGGAWFDNLEVWSIVD